MRPWDGDSDGLPGYDMGAYEYNGFVPSIIWVSMRIYPEGGLSSLNLGAKKYALQFWVRKASM